MNSLTKIIVFLVLTFVFVVLYGHGVSGFGAGVGAEGSALVATASTAVAGAVDAVTKYFYPEEPPPPPPPPEGNPALKSMLDKTPAAIEADVNLRPSTYIPKEKPKPTPAINPRQQPVSIDPHQ
jgi:hypothetical protein